MIPVNQINQMQGKTVGKTPQFVDMFLVYQLMKRLTTPFNKWPAYQKGIIDSNGNVLKKRSSLSPTEQEYWGYFDIVTANMKKVLNKLPGGDSKLKTLAAAVFLFKEQKNISLEHQDVVKNLFEQYLNEENATGPAVVGTGDDKSVSTKKQVLKPMLKRSFKDICSTNRGKK